MNRLRQKIRIRPEVIRQKRREIYDMRETIRLNNDIRERINTLPVPDDLPDWASDQNTIRRHTFGGSYSRNPIRSLCHIHFDFHRHVLQLEKHRLGLMMHTEYPLGWVNLSLRLMIHNSIRTKYKTISGYAKWRGVSESTVRRWINAGKVSAHRVEWGWVDGRWLINTQHDDQSLRRPQPPPNPPNQSDDDLSSRLSIRLMARLNELWIECKELEDNPYYTSKMSVVYKILNNIPNPDTMWHGMIRDSHNCAIEWPDAVYKLHYDAIKQFNKHLAELNCLAAEWYVHEHPDVPDFAASGCSRPTSPNPLLEACLDLSLDARQLDWRLDEYFADLQLQLAPEFLLPAEHAGIPAVHDE